MNSFKKYKGLVLNYNSIVFENLGIKMGSYKGFLDAKQKNHFSIVEKMPLLDYFLESFQVDCVISICKIIEKERSKNTIQSFIKFIESNHSQIQKKYNQLDKNIISQDKASIQRIYPEIERLLHQRDKFFAHADNKYFLEPYLIYNSFQETYNDLSKITSTLQELINRHLFVVSGKRSGCVSDFSYMESFRIAESLK